jgi:hypothetical protein
MDETDLPGGDKRANPDRAAYAWRSFVSYQAGLESDSGSIRRIVCGGVQVVYIYRAVGNRKANPG